MQYIKLDARVRADNVVSRVHTQVKDADRARGSSAEPRRTCVEVVGEDEQLLLRIAVAELRECVLRKDGVGIRDLLLTAYVPLPVAARSMRLVRDGIVLTTLKIAPNSPMAELDWPPPASSRAVGRHAIAWRSTDSAEAFLRFSNDDGRSWYRISGRSTGRAFQVDFDELPGGARCRLALVVTAECRSRTVVSEPFIVEEKRSHIGIVAPRDGTVRAAQTVVLEAYVARHVATLNQSEDPKLVWYSDRDGQLGTGPILATQLTAGRHRVSVRSSDERLEPASESIDVLVAPGIQRSSD